MNKLIQEVLNSKKRIVAPLVGFPGLQLETGSIKSAQQNHVLHFRIIRQIYKRFQPDVIFPMMDLSLEANALGRYAVFTQHESATIPKMPFDEADKDLMKKIDITADARIRSYTDTVTMMVRELPKDVMKAAYVTGPFTLAALLMGADDAAMATMMNPTELHELIEFCTKQIESFILKLIEAGAQMICILEPTGLLLGPHMWKEFSGDYVTDLISVCQTKETFSILHICGNTMPLIHDMAKTGADALSLDSEEAGVHLPEAAKLVPDDVVIIGNINPTGKILTGNPKEVAEEVIQLIESMKDCPNFILSTGCDLPQEVPVENIDAFMKAGRA